MGFRMICRLYTCFRENGGRAPIAPLARQKLFRAMRSFALGGLAILASCAYLLPLQATAAANLHGIVYTVGDDQIQTAWPNAKVTVTHLQTRRSLATVTSEVGEYKYIRLPVGDYRITVELPGFAIATQTFRLAEDQGLELNIRIQPKGRVEQITVRAETGGIETTESSAPSGQTLRPEIIKSAPLVNERFQDALPLLPGVVRGPDGLLNVKGARGTQSGLLVNSATVTDPVTGQFAISLPLEAIESVQVLSSPFSAEYGKFTGGVTEIETRPGSDTWKFLLTNFFPRLRWRDGTIVGLGSITPRVIAAGPVVKGRLYFSQAFDYRFVRTRVESQPNLKNDRVLESFDSLTQIDGNINPNHRFSMTAAVYPQNLSFVTLDTFNPEGATPNFRQRGWQLSFSDRAIFANGSFLESLFSAKSYDAHVFPADPLQPGYVLFPEQNSGSFFNRQDRESFRHDWRQIYHFPLFRAAGTHLLKAGYQVVVNRYDGIYQNLPVTIRREDGTTSQVIRYVGGGPIGRDKNEYTGFVQEKWAVWPRFTLDLGLRYDRDQLSGQNNFAPRLGFVYAPFRDNKTAVRGGIGLFYDKIPLAPGTFTQLPPPVVTRFAADGVTVVDSPRRFAHVLDHNGLKTPYSLSWQFQVDRELTRRLLFRFGYEQRETHNDFLVEPFAGPNNTGTLLLASSGRQRYREFQWTARYQLSERSNFFASYVRSRATGDLNSFDALFGNFPNPVIRPNERSRLPYDAPNRFLFWGMIALPWKLRASPVLDVRNGFPFSVVDSELNFVGPRNRAGRFPTFASLDLQLTRGFAIPFLGKKYQTQIGIKVFNVTNHFNPRDFQANIFSPNFGGFSNGIGRRFRGKFEIAF